MKAWIFEGTGGNYDDNTFPCWRKHVKISENWREGRKSCTMSISENILHAFVRISKACEDDPSFRWTEFLCRAIMITYITKVEDYVESFFCYFVSISSCTKVHASKLLSSEYIFVWRTIHIGTITYINIIPQKDRRRFFWHEKAKEKVYIA